MSSTSFSVQVDLSQVYSPDILSGERADGDVSTSTHSDAKITPGVSLLSPIDK